MINLLRTFMSTLRARFTSIWAKLRLWTSVTFWRTQGVTRLRGFFMKLFNVKPKDKNDYYPVFRWMVSKKLAFALVVAVGLASVYYLLIMSPTAISAQEGATARVRTYKYSSLPLKFVSGKVQILARDGYVAYVGDVEKGHAAGQGTLYDKSGALVYEGQFAQSMYNGSGRLYYSDGTIQYQGAFVNNLYEGEGASYRTNGLMRYQGGWLAGQRSGKGSLYDTGGNLCFTGSFLLDHLLYGEFVGKTATEAGQMYSGPVKIYDSEIEYCVEMPEIKAVYTAANSSGSLEGDPVITGVTVLSDSIQVGGTVLRSISDLSAYFGSTPEYLGTTWANLSEAVAVNLLGDPQGFGQVEMKLSQQFDNVFQVAGYDHNHTVYIYVYQHEGLLYTFYTAGSTEPGFEMYSIATA